MVRQTLRLPMADPFAVYRAAVEPDAAMPVSGRRQLRAVMSVAGGSGFGVSVADALQATLTLKKYEPGGTFSIVRVPRLHLGERHVAGVRASP